MRPVYLGITSNWNSGDLQSVWVCCGTKLRNGNQQLSTTREYSTYQLSKKDTIEIDSSDYIEVLIPRTTTPVCYTELQYIEFRIGQDGSGDKSSGKLYYTNFELIATPRYVINTDQGGGGWSNIQFTISYLEKDGSSFSGTHEEEYPTTYTYLFGATLDTPTKTNCGFGGYYLNSDFSGSQVTSFSNLDSGDKTLYVKWTATITWENYDHYTIKTDTIELGETPEYVGNTPLKPQEGSTSYDFSGWSPTVVAATGHATYTAQYTENVVSPKDTTIMIGVDGEVGTDFFDDTIAIYCWNNTETFRKTVEAHRVGSTRLAYVTIPAGINYFKVVRMQNSGTGKTLPFDGSPWDGGSGWNVNHDWNNLSFPYVYGTDHLENNLLQINKWEDKAGQYWQSNAVVLPQGMPVYVAVDEDVRWWFNDNDTPYLVTGALNDYYGYTKAEGWNKLTRIGSTDYMYFVPNETLIAPQIILTRNTTDTPGWDGKRHNQTTNITVPNGYYNTCLVNIENSGGDLSKNWGPKGMNETIDAYGVFFLDKVQCANDSPKPTNDWTAASNHYSNLGLITQGLIWQTHPNEGGTFIQQAMARYDYIVFYKHYEDYNDFIGRINPDSGRVIYAAQSFKPYEFIIGGEYPYSTIVIIIVSSISLLSITALSILLVRKHKSKEQ